MTRICALAFAGLLAATAHAQAQNTLTPAEEAAGWTLLFDGKGLDHWRGYKQEGFPGHGWDINEGAIHRAPGDGGGDIITRQQYGDFELRFDFKVAPNANSGVIFGVAELHDTTWQTGPEFQILDDKGYGAEPGDGHSVGALYDLYKPPADKPSKPAGEWNTARIRMSDGTLQHYLNGMKIIEVDVTSDEWTERIAGSKFNIYEGFGVQPTGHIALQDHGDEVWYRNVKVRDLDQKMPGEIALFNGRNTDGWTFVLADENADPANTWSVKDGMIVCNGKPNGYIRTLASYDNYVLKVKWRFMEAGNSGVLCRIHGEDKVWPKSVEPQLMVGNAGDFHSIGIDALRLASGESDRQRGGRILKSHLAEHEVGEWNEYEIVADGDRFTIYINGEHVNEAVNAPTMAGPIGLQSEGVEIHFKDIRLSPIR